MVVLITQANFGQYMNMSEGYMVNRAFKTEAPQTRFACAHDVAHHNRGTCRLAYSRDYPKFYASTFQEAQAEARWNWNPPCEVCSNCV